MTRTQVALKVFQHSISRTWKTSVTTLTQPLRICKPRRKARDTWNSSKKIGKATVGVICRKEWIARILWAIMSRPWIFGSKCLRAMEALLDLYLSITLWSISISQAMSPNNSNNSSLCQPRETLAALLSLVWNQITTIRIINTLRLTKGKNITSKIYQLKFQRWIKY